MNLSIRVYDHPTCFDRYTIVLHGRYRHLTDREQFYMGCSSAPFHPMGSAEVNSSSKEIDYPSYKHLGKKLNLTEHQALPDDVKRFIRQTVRSVLEFDYSIDPAELANLVDKGKASFPIIPAKRKKMH